MNRASMVAWGIGGALAVAPMAGGAIPAPGSESRPNILLIVSDDQGYADMGCAGSREALTPSLDRLAREGARLTQFYVAWPACTPSRGALLTGRYPQRNGTYDMFRNEAPDYGHRYEAAEYAVTWERLGGMDTREILLPELLRRAGYATGIFGKWDLGQLRRFLPLQRGFDEFYGFSNTGIDYYTHERYGVPSMMRGDAPTTEDRGAYCTDIFLREASRFIGGRGGRPFFCYVPFNAPHSASSLDPGVRGAAQAPPEVKRRFPALLRHDDEFVSRVNRRTGIEERAPGKGKARLEYLAALASMDDAIGRLLDQIDRLGLTSRTVVVFLSDNGGSGGSDNGQLRGGKSTLWEGGVRVPCIVRWPGVIPAGRVCDGFLTALDIFPTLLGAAGVRVPEGLALDGFDARAALSGEGASPRSEMFWRRRDDRAARVGRWKWLATAKGGGLYDLDADPGESRDRSGDQPEALALVRGRLEAWERAMAAAEPRGPFRDY